MTRNPTITLYGNVGGDPQVRTIPGRQGTSRVYDPILDDLVERPYTLPGREVRTFSIAVRQKGPDGRSEVRWVHCDDWHRRSRLVRKGDRVKVQGTFRERTYQKDGETRTLRTFVVERLGIERKKIRHRLD